MPVFRCVVEYDGTDFHGFQYQPGRRTIAGELERALAQIFAEPVKLTGAGRTDAGVHARGQVISFRAERGFDAGRLVAALNGNLPRDISVRRADAVDDAFNARNSARARTYEYTIFAREQRSAYYARTSHHVYRALDLAKMRIAASALTGEHDFVAFCGSLPDNGITVRTVAGVAIDERPPFIRIRITADGFLHRMVRITVGTLVEVAAGRRDPHDIARIIAAKDRTRAGYTAPPEGLSLIGVRYEAFNSEPPDNR